MSHGMNSPRILLVDCKCIADSFGSPDDTKDVSLKMRKGCRGENR
jgi:hypothetical protein